MKKIWLIHESGKKYGPFDCMDGDVFVRDFGVFDIVLEALGFCIEEELPEKIEVTRETLKRALDREDWVALEETKDAIWLALCEESKKGEVK